MDVRLTGKIPGPGLPITQAGGSGQVSPSNWYWIMLLKTSRRKKTKWWFWDAEKRNQVVEKASSRCSNLLAVTMDRLLR